MTRFTLIKNPGKSDASSTKITRSNRMSKTKTKEIAHI